MEFRDNKQQSNLVKVKFVVYLDLSKTSYRHFIEPTTITWGEIVERILYRYVEQGFVKEKRKEFSLFLINSKYIEQYIKASKNKQVSMYDDDQAIENTLDSANRCPNVMKRKLNHRDRPLEILHRTNK